MLSRRVRSGTAMARRIRGALLRRATHEAPTDPAVTGMVEEFRTGRVTGWLAVPADAPPTRVDLFLGQLKVASTFAKPGSSMSGVTPAQRSAPGAVAETPQDPPSGIPRPAGDRRNSHEEVRTFSFRVRGIWRYVKKSTRITLRVQGRPLPIYGHGTYLLPPKSGRHSVAELRAKLAEGYVLNQFGKVELSKALDTEWQTRVMHLYDRTGDVLRDRFGYDPILIYGSLLGVVREGGYIGHDVDFDAAFVSRRRTGPEAAAEMVEIGIALVEEGLDVDPHGTALHLREPERPDHRIDLFHLYFDHEGVLRFPFGVAGTTTITDDGWATRSVEFRGGHGLVPDQAEAVVEHIYGADWRRPKPGFDWSLDRTDYAPEGWLSEAQRTKVYWANFYTRTGYEAGSAFFEFIQKRETTADTIIDIGCGDGRDSRAFAEAGRSVLGLDQSVVGIDHASSRVSEGIAGAARFRVCDVADTAGLGSTLAEEVGRADGPVLFYMRFFLHAIPEAVQVGLLDAIGAQARPGDQLAAEFRTDKDETSAKVHTKHYRRFQNADAFVSDLGARGWQVEHYEEGTGLSPYRDEDPVLCRVIAHRA
jgi:Methyltransferase domain